MIKKIVLSALALLVIGFCVHRYIHVSLTFKDQQPATEKYLVVAPFEQHAGLKHVKEKVAAAVDAIIAQELDMPVSSADFPHFRVMPHVWTTLYYIEDYLADYEDDLPKTLKLSSVPKPQENPYALLSCNAHFFGAAREDIVLFLDDPQNSLHMLHDAIKQKLHMIEGAHAWIYDIQKSEQFPYNPHISLGHIKTLNYVTKDQAVINRIKKRIEKELFPLLCEWITPNNNQLPITNYAVYSIGQKRTLQTYELS